MKDVINQIKKAYNSNKRNLNELEKYIENNGITEDGITDVSISFEQGYNNALEFVLSLLKQKDTFSLDNSPYKLNEETPYGFKDVVDLLSGKGNSKWTSLDEIEMNEGDGKKLANFLMSKGVKVEEEFEDEWFVKNEYHWNDCYFYPYPND